MATTNNKKQKVKYKIPRLHIIKDITQDKLLIRDFRDGSLGFAYIKYNDLLEHSNLVFSPAKSKRIVRILNKIINAK